MEYCSSTETEQNGHFPCSMSLIPAEETVHQGLFSHLLGFVTGRDVHGDQQGPFSTDQLRAWRDQLPMNLPVWSQSGVAGNANEKELVVELAFVLGDGHLLTDWRQQTTEEVGVQVVWAPFATLFNRL